MMQLSQARDALIALVLLAVSFSATADDRLERFETISERGGEISLELMLRQYASMGADPEEIRAVMPDIEWDDEYREAGQCMLDRYEDIIGNSGIDNMLDRMETLFDELDREDATFEDMEALADMNSIEGVSDDDQIAIMSDCRMLEINMRRMSESGFMDAIQSQLSTMDDNGS